MSLFNSTHLTHLESHKDWSKAREVVSVRDVAKVYIPLMSMNVTQAKILVQPGDHVYVGTKVAERNDTMYVPYFSSVSGIVGKNEKHMHYSLKMADHVVIENDGKYEIDPQIKGLDWQTATREELIDFMKEKGLIGCGGAGFPMYAKYSAKDLNTVIVDLSQCEEYAMADACVVLDHSDDFVLGLQAAKKAAGATKVVVAVPKGDLAEQVKKIVQPTAEVLELDDFYPDGWEHYLAEKVSGKQYNRLPSEVGCVVSNATTITYFGHALKTGLPPVERVVTLAGDGFNKNVNVSCPVGTQYKDLFASAGGLVQADELYLISGGGMMGKTLTKDDVAVVANTSLVTAKKVVNHDVIGCMRCGACVNACPAGLMPVRIMDALANKDAELLDKLGVMQCVECGLCSYVCPSYRPVTDSVRQAKLYLRLHPVAKKEARK